MIPFFFFSSQTISWPSLVKLIEHGIISIAVLQVTCGIGEFVHKRISLSPFSRIPENSISSISAENAENSRTSLIAYYEKNLLRVYSGQIKFKLTNLQLHSFLEWIGGKILANFEEEWSGWTKGMKKDKPFIRTCTNFVSSRNDVTASCYFLLCRLKGEELRKKASLISFEFAKSGH